ncbi:MAG TPA: Sua5/YciO/YrdC/YwlC family protein [Thermoleophilaceae bacterium]|nr:Sua5/YciO/YrdC/YwlC family protein [Thermoleophilaceae bacterium]
MSGSHAARQAGAAGPLGEGDVAAFERCIAGGGIAVFPADTVYGLAASPDSEPAVRRLQELKGREASQPSAVMFFALRPALAALPELGARTRTAFERLLPGPLTLIVANPRGRFPLACGPDTSRLGVRVPALDGPLEPLTAVAVPVLQSSANLHGGADPRRLADVPEEIRAGVDLALDGGDLPGVASTVVDLSQYEHDGRFDVLREGALPAGDLARLLRDTG